MLIFKSRSIGNEPIVTIEANSVEHLLKSRYFSVYTHGSKFSILVDSNCAYITKGDDRRMVIGFIEYR